MKLRWGICGAGLISSDFCAALGTLPDEEHEVTYQVISLQYLKHFVWLRVTDEGSIPEMHIWSTLLIKSNFKWCIHLRRSFFLNFNYLVSVTAGGTSSKVHNYFVQPLELCLRMNLRKVNICMHREVEDRKPS